MYTKHELVTAEFKSGGLHEKLVVATCSLGKHLSNFIYIHTENLGLCLSDVK